MRWYCKILEAGTLRIAQPVRVLEAPSSDVVVER
jgi:MOSC domain-containing protein YiiM